MVKFKVKVERSGQYSGPGFGASFRRTAIVGDSAANSILSFRTDERIALGKVGYNSFMKRLSDARGADDQKMRRLGFKYQKEKFSRGLPGIRDLRFSGRMLGNVSLRSADANKVVIGMTSDELKKIARVHENRESWFQWSPRDEAAILAAAEKIFNTRIVKAVQDRFGLVRAA